MSYRIGFISTRFAGTDGVTLESGKWAHVLQKNDHICYWFAGELDQDENKRFWVPEAHFKHEHNQWINKHVVINTNAQEQLALRSGIAATLIPNVLDFEPPPKVNNRNAGKFRKSIGLQPADKIILQPTRIVQRKGIEHAVELVRSLQDPNYKLIISHAAGDEGYEYAEWLQSYAQERSVDVRLVATDIEPHFPGIGKKNGKYSLWDVYSYADFITYPSLYEGFGNAFLEAVYLNSQSAYRHKARRQAT